jgi:FAD/FMN-containing dehydrogenase
MGHCEEANMKNNDITRRDAIDYTAKAAGVFLALPYLSRCDSAARAATGSTVVNDIHSRLNPTRVNKIFKPQSVEQLARIVASASRQGRTVSLAGKRHAMGGQQFGSDTDLIDMTSFNKIISIDKHGGIIEVESGTVWPSIINYCWNEQKGDPRPWGISQKQTGADALTLGGGLAANVHGRGLTMQPLIQDVESFKLITPKGAEIECGRSKDPELFKLAIGGYGLFGVISSIKLRLIPRTRLKRTVKITDIDELMPAFEQRIQQGYMYGDFQYMTDSTSPDFLKKGVFSCYLPVDSNEKQPESQHRELQIEDWKKLYRLAFTNKGEAFRAYSQYYLGTNDQFYWSDTHQLSVYLEGYHIKLNKELGYDASLMISEIYVPRKDLAHFMEDVRKVAIKESCDIIYGTIRLIKRDNESFLAWAKEDYACVIFNLRVFHTPNGIEKAKRDFRALIDAALRYGGSYYLTYHRWARKDQVLACYPQFPEFLRIKQKHDSKEVIQSDWYRHYKTMFA